MTNRYVDLNTTTGQLTMVVPAVVGGTASAGQIPALNTSGVLDSTMMPAGTGVDSVSVVAKVALSAGNLVNLVNNSGTVNAQLADCSTGLPAHGYVTAAVASGASGTVYLNGLNASVSGLTPGGYVFLSTAGAVSNTPPSTAGYISQIVGMPLSATEIQFRPEQPVTIA